MNQFKTSRYTFFAAALISNLVAGKAWAHGPVVVLSNDNGRIVTNQLDTTPQDDSANPDDYPIGAPARNFPDEYNIANLSAFNGSGYVAPTNLQAIPMVLVTSGSTPANTGYYGQLEDHDAMGNSTLNTGPGYAYGNGGFNSGTIFQITFADALKYWDDAGGTFIDTPDGEQLQAIRSTNAGAAYANTLTSNGAQLGSGLQVIVSASQSPGSHSQLSYRLMDLSGDSTDVAGIADGLYLASFQIGTADTSPASLETSLPYYFLFEKNVNGGITAMEVAAANNYINSTIVPEPTSFAALILGGAMLVARRRRPAV